eukprot:TRINITY_DN13834_c0_g1_i2.p1 TRINITY_DN13834_c0_g1~~TRINITY_DN13834_c0_g1_i2.p1  ORF type:complete len:205 (-),score=48.37 TRINITY_DN13834_c0_g1_i2:825-1439(-)
MYDKNKDSKLSEQDLFEPFLSFNADLYSAVFVHDLPKILNQMRIKLRPNRPKEMSQGHRKPVTSDSTLTVPDFESLTFKEFLLIYESNFYPSLIADILFYVAGIVVPQKIQEQAKKAILKEEPENSETKKQDMELRDEITSILESDKILDKILPAFQKLAENPQKGESRMYITLYSLTKGFVSACGSIGKCVWVHERVSAVQVL